MWDGKITFFALSHTKIINVLRCFIVTRMSVYAHSWFFLPKTNVKVKIEYVNGYRRSKFYDNKRTGYGIFKNKSQNAVKVCVHADFLVVNLMDKKIKKKIFYSIDEIKDNFKFMRCRLRVYSAFIIIYITCLRRSVVPSSSKHNWKITWL